MARYLLDTDVLVDLAKGRGRAQSRLPAIPVAWDELGICTAQLAEFYPAQPHGQQSHLDVFLDTLQLWSSSRDAAIQAGMYCHAHGRPGRTFATPDALTAAVAWRMRATVATGNLRITRCPACRCCRCSDCPPAVSYPTATAARLRTGVTQSP